MRREDLIGFMKKFGLPIPPQLDVAPPFVLIVDDEAEIIDLLSEVMRSGSGNVEVAGARSGVEALLMIGERKPDLLILDIMRPGMNGIEVCERLKSNKLTKNIRIVAISGARDPGMDARALAAGADMFFAKPFDMAAFREGCFNLLNSEKAR